jgi:hypothetical protein
MIMQNGVRISYSHRLLLLVFVTTRECCGPEREPLSGERLAEEADVDIAELSTKYESDCFIKQHFLSGLDLVTIIRRWQLAFVIENLPGKPYTSIIHEYAKRKREKRRSAYATDKME